MAELESNVNHTRRILQSKMDEKAALETKLENTNKEKERQSAIAQSLKTQCLDIQFSMQKIQTEKDDIEKALAESENEKNDIVGKFDLYGAHL